MIEMAINLVGTITGTGSAVRLFIRSYKGTLDSQSNVGTI